MNKGILLFAHNSREVDYACLALISGNLAKKNLEVPVSLVTDSPTVEWMKTSGIYSTVKQTFDKIILTDRPLIDNVRKLHDGEESTTVPFINANRSMAWDLTPYDRTLLIDVDFLIFSKQLTEYWDVDEEFLISTSINDIFLQSRLGYHDRYISDTGIHLYWATTVMFSKTEKSKLVFDLVKHIKNNYEGYGDLYRFNTQQYRNDISFSIAKHMIDGFSTDTCNCLPPVLTTIDKDILIDVSYDKLSLLIHNGSENYIVSTMQGVDLHIMNKQSIIRNKEKLLGLV